MYKSTIRADITSSIINILLKKLLAIVSEGLNYSLFFQMHHMESVTPLLLFGTLNNIFCLVFCTHESNNHILIKCISLF